MAGHEPPSTISVRALVHQLHHPGPKVVEHLDHDVHIPGVKLHLVALGKSSMESVVVNDHLSSDPELRAIVRGETESVMSRGVDFQGSVKRCCDLFRWRVRDICAKSSNCRKVDEVDISLPDVLQGINAGQGCDLVTRSGHPDHPLGLWKSFGAFNQH